MKTVLIVGLILWTSILSAQEVTAPAAIGGQRVEIQDAGFSIVPPNGWEIIRNAGGSSLLFRAPKQEEGQLSLQGTIQVMVFNGGRYIDDFTQEEYGKLIVEKFAAASNRVTQYRLRSQQKVKLENGDDAILYYTEFQMDEAQIMQMHILMSSARKHFLLTYTDFAKYFEQDNSRELAVAFTSMHSAVLDSQPPSRYYFPIVAGGGVLGLILLGFSIKAFRSYRLRALSERLEEEDGEELHTDAESQFYSQHTRFKKKKSSDDDEEEDDEDEGEEELAATKATPPSRKIATPLQKAAPPPPRINATPVTEGYEDEGELPTHERPESDVARLSDILPNDGTQEEDGELSEKKRSFFGKKGKSSKEKEESWETGEAYSHISEANPLASTPPRPLAKVAKARPMPPASSAVATAAVTSQVAPLTDDVWNLEGPSESYADDDEEDTDDRI